MVLKSYRRSSTIGVRMLRKYLDVSSSLTCGSRGNATMPADVRGGSTHRCWMMAHPARQGVSAPMMSGAVVPKERSKPYSLSHSMQRGQTEASPHYKMWWGRRAVWATLPSAVPHPKSGDVVQWENVALARRRSWVRVPSFTLTGT